MCLHRVSEKSSCNIGSAHGPWAHRAVARCFMSSPAQPEMTWIMKYPRCFPTDKYLPEQQSGQTLACDSPASCVVGQHASQEWVLHNKWLKNIKRRIFHNIENCMKLKFVGIHKVLFKTTIFFICLSMAVFMSQWQSRIVMSEITCPAKPNRLTS